MGGGQSTFSKDEILAQAKQYYSDNPEDFEEMYRKVKESKTKSQSKEVVDGATLEEGSFSKEIADEMTLLRLDPPAYATHIENHLKTFQDDFAYKRENENVLIRTNEGKKAVDECISALKEQAPLCNITPSVAGYFA